MFRLACKAVKAIGAEIPQLPWRAAAALGAAGMGEAARPERLRKACAIILPVGALVAWVMPQLTLVMSPSIDAWIIRKAPGEIRRGDLVSFRLIHPLAGPTPVDVTKYALCFPGDRIVMIEKPSLTFGARDGWYYCNGRLLGISKAVGHNGQRLLHWRPSEQRIAAGLIYVGSRYAGGFDSRYYGPIFLSQLTRMEKLL